MCEEKGDTHATATTRSWCAGSPSRLQETIVSSDVKILEGHTPDSGTPKNAMAPAAPSAPRSCSASAGASTKPDTKAETTPTVRATTEAFSSDRRAGLVMSGMADVMKKSDSTRPGALDLRVEQREQRRTTKSKQVAGRTRR